MTPQRKADRIVFGFSGSASSSAALARLLQRRGAEVVTVTLDLGQASDPAQARAHALALGALRAHVMDVRDTYARCHVLPALQQGGADLLPALETSAAPLIGRTLAEIARIEQAAAVAHAGSAQDHAAIAAAVRDMDPALDVLALAGSADGRERADAAPAGTTASPAPHYAVGGALWGRSLRPVGTAAAAPPESLFAVNRSSWRGQEIAATLDVAFESGVPVAVNDVPMPLPELIESVATIAGHHAVGRIVDSGSLTVYEAPAAVVLAEAHRALVSSGGAQGSGTIRLRLRDGECLVVDRAEVTGSPHVSALAGHAS